MPAAVPHRGPLPLPRSGSRTGAHLLGIVFPLRARHRRDHIACRRAHALAPPPPGPPTPAPPAAVRSLSPVEAVEGGGQRHKVSPCGWPTTAGRTASRLCTTSHHLVRRSWASRGHRSQSWSRSWYRPQSRSWSWSRLWSRSLCHPRSLWRRPQSGRGGWRHQSQCPARPLGRRRGRQHRGDRPRQRRGGHHRRRHSSGRRARRRTGRWRGGGSGGSGGERSRHCSRGPAGRQQQPLGRYHRRGRRGQQCCRRRVRLTCSVRRARGGDTRCGGGGEGGGGEQRRRHRLHPPPAPRSAPPHTHTTESCDSWGRDARPVSCRLLVHGACGSFVAADVSGGDGRGQQVGRHTAGSRQCSDHVFRFSAASVRAFDLGLVEERVDNNAQRTAWQTAVAARAVPGCAAVRWMPSRMAWASRTASTAATVSRTWSMPMSASTGCECVALVESGYSTAGVSVGADGPPG